MSIFLALTLPTSLLRACERCLQAKEAPAMGAHGGKEPVAQALPSPFAASEEQSTLATPPQPVPQPGCIPRQPTPLSPMQNGMAGMKPQADGPMQPSLTPEVLRRLLLANGIPEGAAAMGSERGATACTMTPKVAESEMLSHLSVTPEVHWGLLMAIGIPAGAAAMVTGTGMHLPL